MPGFQYLSALVWNKAKARPEADTSGQDALSEWWASASLNPI